MGVGSRGGRAPSPLDFQTWYFSVFFFRWPLPGRSLIMVSFAIFRSFLLTPLSGNFFADVLDRRGSKLIQDQRVLDQENY